MVERDELSALAVGRRLRNTVRDHVRDLACGL